MYNEVICILLLFICWDVRELLNLLYSSTHTRTHLNNSKSLQHIAGNSVGHIHTQKRKKPSISIITFGPNWFHKRNNENMNFRWNLHWIKIAVPSLRCFLSATMHKDHILNGLWDVFIYWIFIRLKLWTSFSRVREKKNQQGARGARWCTISDVYCSPLLM